MQSVSSSLPYWVRFAGALGPVIVGFASVVLSLALAFLYNEQKKLQEANHKAALEVINWDWDGDELDVEVANYGNGVARNLSLTTLAYADNGAHRRFVAKSNVLKHGNQDNPWANAVEPDGEPKKLSGKRRVGELAPTEYPTNWVSISFDNFLRRMKEKGVEELKFCFVIQGVELSDRKSWTLLRDEMMVTNPQKYSRDTGMNSVTFTGHDGTFDRYFSRSFVTRWRSYLYVSSFALLGKVPILDLHPRKLDVSGTSRVKRLMLRRKICYPFRIIWSKLARLSG
jgi:hypothetical protein